MSNTTNALIVAVLAVIGLFGFLSWQRDSGSGGPHHDEVIALMAAKALERDYAHVVESGGPPFHELVPASRWHHYSHDFSLVDFDEIREDVLTWDKHPPLAFWVMNRWLSLFDNGGYSEAVILMWLQVLLAAAILAMLIYRISGSSSAAVLGFALFLVGNSAVFTGTWVRQYALFIVLYAGVMAAAVELVRESTRAKSFAIWSTVLAALSLCGMMTQYTFLTMSAPIHATLLALLAVEGKWLRVWQLLVVYAIAGVLFFFLLPGVLNHVQAVSAGLERSWQWKDALGGVPQMYIPMPSALPDWLGQLIGAVGLVLPFAIATVLLRLTPANTINPSRSVLAVPLAGMLGAGLLQFVLVGLGYFPGWSTGPNHLAALWLLTVFATALLWAKVQFKGKWIMVVLVFVGLLGMQGLYTWHLHRIAPKLNKSYIASLQPDLVVADNLARGFVLELTDVMPADQPVLVTNSARAAERFTSGSLNAYASILYLPMDQSVREGKAALIAAAQVSGWEVTELPVVHFGMYEAILIEQASQAEVLPVPR